MGRGLFADVSPVLPYPHPSVPDASGHGLVYADFSCEAWEAGKESVCCAIGDSEDGEAPQVGAGGIGSVRI